MTDEERDAHLRAALRHAPDAQLRPPPDLSALILSEARAKARDAAAAASPPRSLVAVVWDWLARPSVATGFASVMAATLVGLMWWDQPMDEARPRSPVPAAVLAPAPVAPEATTSAAATPSPVPTAPAVPAAPTAQEALRRTTAQREQQKEQRKPAQDEDKKMAESTVAAPAAAPVVSAAPATEPTGSLAQAPREASAAAKPAAVAAPPAFTDQAARSVDAPAKAKSSSAEPARSRLATGGGEAMNARGAAKTESNDTRERQEAEAAATSIGRLRSAIAAEPLRWTWQRGSGTAQAMNDALYAWLAQLDSASTTPWPTRAARETAAPLGRELRLLRDGRVLHTLRLTERSVLWESGQSSRQVELPEATLAELQAALNAAAP